MSFLLRVVLPDRPGMLGAVATAIGRVGGDIVSLDVVERGPAGAVDDLLVVVPLGGLADTLISSAQSVEGSSSSRSARTTGRPTCAATWSWWRRSRPPRSRA